jgi:hypothetical protein
MRPAASSCTTRSLPRPIGVPSMIVSGTAEARRMNANDAAPPSSPINARRRIVIPRSGCPIVTVRAGLREGRRAFPSTGSRRVRSQVQHDAVGRRGLDEPEAAMTRDELFERTAEIEETSRRT